MASVLAKHWMMLFMKQVLPRFFKPLALFGRLELNPLTDEANPFNFDPSDSSETSLSDFSSSYSRHLQKLIC
jgi:hypothetical protein